MFGGNMTLNGKVYDQSLIHLFPELRCGKVLNFTLWVNNHSMCSLFFMIKSLTLSHQLVEGSHPLCNECHVINKNSNK